MATRQRPVDIGAREARDLTAYAGREIRLARRLRGTSQRVAARRAGMSASQVGRIERGEMSRVPVDQLCRLARVLGLRIRLRAYPVDDAPRDRPQLALLARLETRIAAPLRMRREVGLPIPGDLRAWDGRITGEGAQASVEAESRLEDVQAIARRIELKARDDPDAGPVILVLNRTAHNRRILAAHREALRAQFPLDGAAIARALRAGRVPPASGIILL